jgi:Kef-type K+ transport system membrane component KefB
MEKFTFHKRALISILFFAALSLTPAALAASGVENNQTTIFLWIAGLLLLARLSHLIERIGQPAVMGELVIGIILGNLSLFGINTFEQIKSDTIIQFLSEIGIVILLFQIGLRSNIHQLRSVGGRALLVALLGTAIPFLLGLIVIGPFFFPDLSIIGHLFIGAALATTSAGITERVLKDLNVGERKESRIILAAAVLSDVFSLILLGAATRLASTGTFSVSTITVISLKACVFLFGAIILGYILAPSVVRLFSKVHASAGMKFTFAVSAGLLMAFVAEQFELAPIIGAFAAGLILDPVDFQYFNDPDVVKNTKEALKNSSSKSKKNVLAILDTHAHKHVEEIIDSLGYFLVPFFFIYTGMQVEIKTLFDAPILGIGLVVSIVAIIGKYISGFVAGKGVNKPLIGIGMAPRGEIGLIFASIGAGLGALTPEAFTVIIIMVNVTTIATPYIMAKIINKSLLQKINI